jgi:hypothetical protein
MSYDLEKLQADVAPVQHDEAGFSTGRLIADNLVLTAGHVLCSDDGPGKTGLGPVSGWKVRLARDYAPEGWQFRCGNRVVWHDPDLDLALIELVDLAGPTSTVSFVSLG